MKPRMPESFVALRTVWTDWGNFTLLSAVLLTLEAIASCYIVKRVPYTEIDWIAYMQEVEGWLGGESDYVKLRGDTGPLVYPAGFVYAYSLLRSITYGGRGIDSIRVAQWMFVGIYLVSQFLVLQIYKSTKPGPPWIACILVLSKRIHSLYFLRLFNDGIAMMIAYGFILCAVKKQWWIGTLLFSLALSVKMNVLLFLPGLLFVLVRNQGLALSTFHIVSVVVIQLVLGAPFLAEHPASYLTRAFELSRVFQYKWTVNLKFLPEVIFVSKRLATVLLLGHLLILILICHFRWCKMDGGLFRVLHGIFSKKKCKSSTMSGNFNDSAWLIGFSLLSSNFVGIVFARTLHYQFYTWYFHALPFLLWSTRLATPARIGVMMMIEYSFNVGNAEGAATPFSSAVLQIAHIICLGGLLVFPSGKNFVSAKKST
jgi:alpha-1,3-mannosyltransferase